MIAFASRTSDPPPPATSHPPPPASRSEPPASGLALPASDSGPVPAETEALKTEARGELSYSKVRALTRVATVENEAEVLDLARHATATHAEKLVRVWRRVDRLESAEAEAQRHRSRFLGLHPDDDGSWVIRGRLDPEVGAGPPSLCQATRPDGPIPTAQPLLKPSSQTRLSLLGDPSCCAAFLGCATLYPTNPWRSRPRRSPRAPPTSAWWRLPSCWCSA